MSPTFYLLASMVGGFIGGLVTLGLMTLTPDGIVF